MIYYRLFHRGEKSTKRSVTCHRSSARDQHSEDLEPHMQATFPAILKDTAILEADLVLTY